MKKRNIIISIAGLVIIVGAIIALMFVAFPKQEVSQSDPVDIVLDFYTPWLEAKQSETTDPYTAGLLDEPFLGKELRSKLKKAQKDIENPIDPVLCQERSDIKLSTRSVSVQEESVQILVTARGDKSLTGQALIILNRLNDGWYIYDITCSPGEFGIDREFSFEQVGFLLKQSIPKPYNPENWHLVFKQDEQDGHVVPLFFAEDTMCTDLKGRESVCSTESFGEASKVSIKAQMTEAGAQVKKLEFVK